jgi:hypothetical protein
LQEKAAMADTERLLLEKELKGMQEKQKLVETKLKLVVEQHAIL